MPDRELEAREALLSGFHEEIAKAHPAVRLDFGIPINMEDSSVRFRTTRPGTPSSDGKNVAAPADGCDPQPASSKPNVRLRRGASIIVRADEEIGGSPRAQSGVGT